MTAAIPTPVAQAARSVLGAPTFQVRYSKLFLSDNNVRSKKQRTRDGVRDLAAMIDADGLLNDLHVTPELDRHGRPTGRYGVEEGGRRLMAIGLLIEAKRLDADPLVNCKPVPEGRATGVSLAANISVQRMHPADEFAAFAKLIAEGKSLEEVAKQFAVNVVDVQRRMKLAHVAPALIEQYREDKINLEQLMALATVDEHKRQLAVWKSLPDYQRSASTIRRRLTEDEVAQGDPRVKLIGMERYAASGGTTRADLFTDQVFLEAGLVDMIVSEILSEAVERVQAEGWAWVEVFESMGYQENERFSAPPKKYLPESDEDRRAREEMEAALDKVEEDYNDLSDASDGENDEDNTKLTALDAKADELRAKLDALRDQRLDTSGYDRSALGAVVTVESGVLKIKRGLMLAKDAKIESKRQAAIQKGMDPKAVPSGGAEFSEKLMLNLTSHRTAAVQATLTRSVPVALAVLADRLFAEVFRSATYGVSDTAQIHLTQCAGKLEANGTAMAESAAAMQLAAQREQWEARVPQGGERLTWLLRQPQDVVLALIAFCTALSVDLIERRASEKDKAEALADALELDLADWWTVGVENFLAHVPKARIGAIVTEACGVDAAAPLAAMKKGDACAKAAELLAETRWLPTPLRLGSKFTSQAASASEAPAGESADAT